MDDVADFAVTVLWLTSLTLPALIFLAIDRFRSKAFTAAGALIAIGAGWLFVHAYAIAAQALAGNDPREINGAALAFSSVFGWTLPMGAVLVAWCGSRAVRRFAVRQNEGRPAS